MLPQLRDLNRLRSGVVVYFCTAVVGLLVLALVLKGNSSSWTPIVVSGSPARLEPTVAGTIVEAHFTLTNVSDEVVEVDRIDVNCGCVSTELSTRVIPKRGAADLLAVVNTEGKLGEVKFTVTCWSRKRQNPIADLRGSVLVLRK
jgi:hypothetical protein